MHTKLLLVLFYTVFSTTRCDVAASSEKALHLAVFFYSRDFECKVYLRCPVLNLPPDMKGGVSSLQLPTTPLCA